jgi:hypothetical protein
LGAVIKGTAYCEVKGYLPIFGTPNYCNVLESLADNARSRLATMDPDPFWARRARTLDVAHNEFIDANKLSGMSVSDVLKLRSAAWGDEAAARTAFFESLMRLADEIADDGKFVEVLRERIREYREAAETVVRERKDLGYKASLDVAMRAAATYGGTTLLGAITQTQTPITSYVALLGIAAWSAKVIKDHVSTWTRLRAYERTIERESGWGLYNYYRRLGKISNVGD